MGRPPKVQADSAEQVAGERAAEAKAATISDQLRDAIIDAPNDGGLRALESALSDLKARARNVEWAAPEIAARILEL